MSYATCCPFHSKVISTEESGLNILTNTHKSCSGVGCWLPLTPALRFHYLCLYCPVRLWFQLCIHTIVPGFLNIYPVFSQRFVGFSIQLLGFASYSRCWQFCYKTSSFWCWVLNGSCIFYIGDPLYYGQLKKFLFLVTAATLNGGRGCWTQFWNGTTQRLSQPNLL